MDDAVYTYIIRYTFEDREKHEYGHGTFCYNTMTKIKDSPFDLFSYLEKEIAFARKHENVSITCYALQDIEYLS